MIVWILLAIYILFIYLLMGRLNTPKKRKRYLMLAGFAIALVMSLRGDHGGQTYDFRVYINSFELIAEANWERIFNVTEFEHGFVILCKLLSYISKKGQILVVFQSCFCIYAVCRFIYRNTDHVFETLFFFVTLGCMGFMVTGIRQSIAIGVILFSIEYIKKRRFFLFLILVLIASTVHVSSIVFIAAYFLINIDIFRRNKYLAVVTVIFVFMMADRFINTAALYLYEKDWEVSDVKFSFNGIVNVLIYGASVAYQFLKIRRNADKTKATGFMLSIAGYCVYLMRFITLTMERVSLYFVFPILIGLSDIYTDTRKQDKGILKCFFIIIMCLILYIRRISNADYGNYVFFWS